MEVVTIEREKWRSVGTSSGGECVMMGGMKEIQLLYAGNWDFQKKGLKLCMMLILNMFDEHAYMSNIMQVLQQLLMCCSQIQMLLVIHFLFWMTLDVMGQRATY